MWTVNIGLCILHTYVHCTDTTPNDETSAVPDETSTAETTPTTETSTVPDDTSTAKTTPTTETSTVPDETSETPTVKGSTISSGDMHY